MLCKQCLTACSSGNLDMTKVLPFLGNTELEVLSVVGAFLLVLTHAATAYCVKEKVVVDTPYVSSRASVGSKCVDLIPAAPRNAGFARK